MGVIGTSVVLVGIAMLVLPGPALVVIPAGLAILGIEFAWARRWLESIKAGTQKGLTSLGLVVGAATASSHTAPRSLDPTANSPHAATGPPDDPAGSLDIEKVTNVPEEDL